jgi:hypothetical protein
VAIGALANAGAADAIGVPAIAFGGSCGPLVCTGVTVPCSLEVCVSVVVVGLLGGWKTIVAVVVLVLLVVVLWCVLFC